MFTVSQNGKPVSKDKYTWDETTKTFSTKENNLVLDFGDLARVVVNAGYDSTITTGNYSTITTDVESSLTYFERVVSDWKIHVSLISGTVKLDDFGVLSKVSPKREVTLTLTEEQIDSLKKQGIM